jgi:hypothetical protein
MHNKKAVSLYFKRNLNEEGALSLLTPKKTNTPIKIWDHIVFSQHWLRYLNKQNSKVQRHYSNLLSDKILGQSNKVYVRWIYSILVLTKRNVWRKLCVFLFSLSLRNLKLFIYSKAHKMFSVESYATICNSFQIFLHRRLSNSALQ